MSSLTIMLDEYLSVNRGGVHEEVPGLGGQHTPHHRSHGHGEEPRHWSLHHNVMSIRKNIFCKLTIHASQMLS